MVILISLISSLGGSFDNSSIEVSQAAFLLGVGLAIIANSVFIFRTGMIKLFVVQSSSEAKWSIVFILGKNWFTSRIELPHKGILIPSEKYIKVKQWK